jgi:tetratricopeptide (TPR) repeat protein
MKFAAYNLRLPSILFIMTQGFLSFTTAEPSSWIDSMVLQYSIAAKNYNIVLLQKSAEFITRQPIEEQQKPQALLLLGFIYWRQELIAYCSNTPAEINQYGKLAIEKLNEAEKAGADKYLTASHKALSCQLLAGQNIGKGAIYGPRAAKELKKAQSENPQGYFSLLVEAINANQAPSFAGGSPKKAVILLEKMATDFPDSIDVKIHLSEAYSKIGRSEDARYLIEPIVNSQPFNLLARKIAKRVLGARPCERTHHY